MKAIRVREFCDPMMGEPMKFQLAYLVICLSGCSSPNGSPDKSPAPTAEGCLGGVCQDSAKDCQMAERCNTAVSPPRCQKLYCGATGTACDQDSICAQGVFCVSRKCVTGDMLPPYACDLPGHTPHICFESSQGTKSAGTDCGAAAGNKYIPGGHLVAACSRDGVVGGCKWTEGSKWDVTWYYGGNFACSPGETQVAP